MAKNPDDRFPSAVAFARALQKVQIELSHSVTPIDIVDDHPPAEDLDDDGDGLTRVREIVSIDPDVASFTRPSATTQRKEPPAALPGIPRFDAPLAETSSVPSVEQTQLRAPTPTPAPPQPLPPSADDRTIARAPQVVAPDAAVPPAMVPGTPLAAPAAPEAPRSRKGLWIGLAAAGVVIVIGGIVGLNLLVAGITPGTAGDGRGRRPEGCRHGCGAEGDRARRDAAGRTGRLHLDEPEPARRRLVHLDPGGRVGRGRSAADAGSDRYPSCHSGNRVHRRDAATRRRARVRDRAGVRGVSGEGGVTVEFAGSTSRSVEAGGSSSDARATSNSTTICSCTGTSWRSPTPTGCGGCRTSARASRRP